MGRKIDFEKILGRVFIVLLASLISVFLIDRASLFFLTHRKSDIERSFPVQDMRQPKPYVMFGGKPHGESWPLRMNSGELRIAILNELGYRWHAPKFPKPKGEFRIIVLGGSAAFMGNPPVPRLIQYQFEKKGCYDVKVYNFAVVSSVTSMELARMVFDVVNHDPDLVISYSGFNDIDLPFESDPRPGFPFNYAVYENNPLLESDIKSYPALTLFLYGSNLMRYFFPRYFVNKFVDMEALREKSGYCSEPWEEEIADIYIDNMLKSHKIAKAFGADFMCFLQPALYFKKNFSDKEKEYIDVARQKNALRIKDLILKKIAGEQQQSFLFYDLTGMFDNNPESIFTDRVHVYYRFRPVIAKKIYAAIMDYFHDHPQIPLNSECRAK